MKSLLFLKLIKAYHPDTTSSLQKKAIYGELSRYIIQAHSDGDEATLEEIDRLGEAYLETAKDREAEEADERRTDERVREAHRRFVRMQEDHDTRGEWSYAYPIIPPRSNFMVDILKAVIFPYHLTFAICDWGKNGRLYNAASLFSGVAWMGAWWKIWGLLGALELAASASGYSHDGAIGLLFVLLRGALILAALPVAVPLVMMAGAALIGTGVLLLIAWFLGGILSLFHPWLAYGPDAVAAVILSLAGWEVLGEDW